MVMTLVIRGNNNMYGYTKVEKEDKEEKTHREAQFMIYKTMKKIDQIATRRSPKHSWLKLRICKLKVRIGNKLLTLRKTMLCHISKSIKVGVSKHLKSFKRFFNNGGGGRGGGGGGRRGGGDCNHIPPPLIIC
ncbi:hypothetical protein vseg_011531 [Gypsophila vaccaria]